MTKKIPQAISGLVRFVGKSSGTVSKIGAKCFSTQLMKYGCFTGSTSVYTSRGSQKLIKNIKLHDIVLSHGKLINNNPVALAEHGFLSLKDAGNKKLNAVSFVSDDGLHSCQLSLNDASLDDYDIRVIGDYVFLSIPEQGLDGIYTVTDIRKINPPKIPSDENPGDHYVYSTVSGIFMHTSDDVWKLTFDHGKEVEVTSMHPFMDAVTEMWRPVAYLKAGDVVKTKEGIAVLTFKEKLEGTHTVYNFTVDATHNYLVGDAGYLVHNSCGDLDKLATRFISNFSKALRKQEITNWWAKRIIPDFFKRGTFFERLMSKGPRYSGWNLTPHTHETIDFWKKIGGVVKVASMKTTVNESLTSWMSLNAKHLVKLNNLQESWAKQGLPEVRALHIYVQDSKLGEYTTWAATIKSQYPNIKEVIINSIEKEFQL